MQEFHLSASINSAAYHEMLDELASLQEQQDRIEEEIQECEEISGALEHDRLTSELAKLNLERGELARILGLFSESIPALQRELAEATIFRAYSEALNSMTELRVAECCEAKLLHDLQALISSLIGAPSKDNGKRTASVNTALKSSDPLWDLLNERTTLVLNHEEVLLKKSLALLHRKAVVKDGIDRVVELNLVIDMLDGQIVDMNEVLSHFDGDLLMGTTPSQGFSTASAN
jgi:hypothetical protein